MGKDDLTATFVNRPFEIDWSPGDKVVVEVWDRKGILFDRRESKMALPEPGLFPLASGTHALGVSGRSGSQLDSELNRIVLQSQRTWATLRLAAAGIPGPMTRTRSRSDLVIE